MSIKRFAEEHMQVCEGQRTLLLNIIALNNLVADQEMLSRLAQGSDRYWLVAPFQRCAAYPGNT